MVDPLYFNKQDNELNEVKLDMKEKFMSHGNLLDIRIVAPEKAQFGAEAGSIFVEYDDSKSSEITLNELKGIKYDTRIVHTAYVKPDMYKEFFKPISESFIEIQAIPEIPIPYQMTIPVPVPNPQIHPSKDADYEFE